MRTLPDFESAKWLKPLWLLALLGLVAAVAVLLSGGSESRQEPAGSTIEVNSTGDDHDDDGECTLREAIVAANTDTASGSAAGECVAGSGRDTVSFNISGTANFVNNAQDGFTIRPRTALPVINESVTIDGYSQPGSKANSAPAPHPFNGTLLIELDGTDAGRSSSGLVVSSSSMGTTIRGLVINSFGHVGIGGSGGGLYTTIQGNYVGTDPTGLADKGNGNHGIQSGEGAIIGGLRPEDRNILSGNDVGGASPNVGDDDWLVQGNYVGVDASGLVALPNSSVDGDGSFSLDNSNNHQVGGPEPTAINVIAGNNSMGIAPHNTEDVLIEGNYFGVGFDGETPVPNGGGGISFSASDRMTIKSNIISNSGNEGVSAEDGSTDGIIKGNTIEDNGQDGIRIFGESFEILGNTISGNGASGVALFDGAKDVSITGNSIHGNAKLGILLSEEPADLETYTAPRPNGLLNAPRITAVEKSGANLFVSFSLDAPMGSYHIELFSNLGETLFGVGRVEVAGGDEQNFTLAFSGPRIVGPVMTATKIDASGEGFGATSEFGGLAFSGKSQSWN